MRTADGKKVKDGLNVWFCFKRRKEDTFKDEPTISIAETYKENSLCFFYFSTKKACQDYINSFNKKTKCKAQNNS